MRIPFICNHLWLSLLFIIICNHLWATIPYSESRPDSNFAISLASNFDSSSESYSESADSESDFISVFMNLDICIFFILYLHSSK